MFFKDKLKLTKLPVSRILPNPSQPRKVFRQEELEALAQSIKENGLLQPVTVRRENGAFYLIAGERRLRACKLAGLREIPALIADCQPEDSAVAGPAGKPAAPGPADVRAGQRLGKPAAGVAYHPGRGCQAAGHQPIVSGQQAAAAETLSPGAERDIRVQVDRAPRQGAATR